MKKYKEKFKFQTAAELLDILIAKTKMQGLNKEKIKICKKYFPKSELKDVIHASTALETGAIFITNNKHFNKIRNKGIIKVWPITSAIQNVLD